MAKRRPIRGIVDVMSEMERMRHLGKTGYDREYADHERTLADAWVPTADIFARNDDLVILMELPGLPGEAIDITFSDGTLTVSGERDAGPGQAEGMFLTRERYYGAFRRSIGLPDSVDDGDISAAFDDGLLAITIRGACASTAAQPRRIPIGGGSR